MLDRRRSRGLGEGGGDPVGDRHRLVLVGEAVDRIPNSSPPKRATMSPGRRWARSRGATARSSSSPAWWPRLSLISLKWSRSRKRIPTGEPETVARSSASLSESTKLSRLGRPVSESWRAARVSRSSAALRSVMSPHVMIRPWTDWSLSRFWTWAST